MNMSSKCVLHACVCIPVVLVGEVVYNGRADAGHAPLAVVPSSCDDRELRSTETLLTIYKRRTNAYRIQLTGAMRTNCERDMNKHMIAHMV